jgi:hypothetical protein
MCSAPHQRKAFEAIRDCRTAALGGHVEYVEQCDTCGHRVISYNSCRDRHCPKVSGHGARQMAGEREGELLPVPYFHVVFTLPQQIGGWRFRMRARSTHPVSRRIGNAAHDCGRSQTSGRGDRVPRRSAHVGTEPSSSSASALRRAGRRHQTGRRSWIGCRKPSFFLPIEVLGSRFRNVFLIYLRKAFRGRQAALPRRDGRSGETGRVRSPVPQAENQMGCLCQAALRRTGAGSEVSGPLHASGRHLQSTAVVDGRWPRDFLNGRTMRTAIRPRS